MLEKQCRNLLHAEWVNQYNGCDSDISTLKRVKVSERNAYEKLVLGETFKCQCVNFAWICRTLCIPIRLLTLKRPLCLNMTTHQRHQRYLKGGGCWTSLTTETKKLAVNQTQQAWGKRSSRRQCLKLDRDQPAVQEYLSSKNTKVQKA